MQVLEAIHITRPALDILLNDPDTGEQTLETYYDLVQTSPFEIEYRLKSHVIILDENGKEDLVVERGLLLDVANAISRNKKNKLYVQQMKAGKRKIVAEGDSWFEHPHPKVDEILTHLGKYYAVYSLAAGGDVLRNMFATPYYLDAIEAEDPEFFLISAGGNDILGSQFRSFLNDYTPGIPGQDAGRFINDFFHREMQGLKDIYGVICSKVINKFPHIRILLHGYDYVIPLSVTDKGWLGRYMIEKGITDPADKEALIKYILNIFNGAIKEVAEADPLHIYFIDVRGTVPSNRWYDEIHPTSEGFQDVALKFMKQIDGL